MGFRYAFLCDLLEKLQTLHSRYPPYLPRDLKEFTRRAVTTWFQKHGYKIRAEADPFVLLSFLLADKYNDRDYGLSGDTIERIIGRAFSLSSAQLTALRAEEWNGSSIDLGTCVQLVTGDRVSNQLNGLSSY